MIAQFTRLCTMFLKITIVALAIVAITASVKTMSQNEIAVILDDENIPVNALSWCIIICLGGIWGGFLGFVFSRNP